MDTDKPLFVPNDSGSGQIPQLGNPAYLHRNRTPTFRYQGMSRLANMTTTHSNVYAIWITVGYFEVDRATGQLGQEAGSDTGEIERHRAFYIFDRSVPVAYERGENHNVDRGLLIRRFIE